MPESNPIIAGGRTFALTRATPEDAGAILAILDDAARWLVARGIDQWHPGDFLRAPLLRIIARGEVYLARHADDPAATLTLQWEDVPTWGVMPPDAAYVHGFAVRRAYGGLGLGSALLHWAASQAVEGGKTYLRLDCLASNPALRAYYERAGFTLRGLMDDDQSALYERQLTTVPPSGSPPRTGEGLGERSLPRHATSPAGDLTIAPATPADVETVVRLDEESAAWARARGREPGEPPIPLRDIVARRVARGEAYLARLGDVPVATLTLQWADVPVWGADDTGDALYVHGLMVSRAHAGLGIGLALLDWAGRVASAAGKTWLRLDCRADNPALRAYYERAGFVYRGDVRLPNYHGARYQRRLDDTHQRGTSGNQGTTQQDDKTEGA